MQKIAKKEQRRGRIYAYAPLFLWIALIFLLSSTLGSMSHTSLIIRPILEWLFPEASPEAIALYHAYVRKFAHFTEYAILAFWARRAFRDSSKKFLRAKPYLASFTLVVVVAVIDEISQRFNATRTGSIYDVLLDISGGLAMIVFMFAVARLRKG